MIVTGTLASVIDGIYRGEIVLASVYLGFGNWFCYLPDTLSHVHGTIFNESSMIPWTAFHRNGKLL